MSDTPLRKQYLRIKQKYPDAIVFFRLGDFYETFDEDARITSRELEIVLTSREMGKGREGAAGRHPLPCAGELPVQADKPGLQGGHLRAVDPARQRPGGAGCDQGGNARHRHRAGSADRRKATITWSACLCTRDRQALPMSISPPASSR